MNINVAILFGLVTLLVLSFMLEVTALGAFLRTIAIMAVPAWIMYRWYDEVLGWVNARIFSKRPLLPGDEGYVEEKASGGASK